MKIKDMFAKKIDREIQGVIIVGQGEDANVSQELEEYVVTRELQKHFADFYSAYKKGIAGTTPKMGVWISGFFGSGKSHFLKILSYLLENRQVGDRKAMDYFVEDKKIVDPMVLADMKLAADTPTDVILFNIDSKSETNGKQNKDAIVNVFLKVFNQMQGFCGSIPHVADLERRLSEEGRYDEFKAAFEEEYGDPWEDSRQDFDFIQDSVVDALVSMDFMSEAAARNWCEKAVEPYTISIEDFAKRVKSYIERKGNNHHVVFLVDEIGQYIGDDSKLMLNLQTVTEELGKECMGKAWVIVTSQQDIDSITKVKGNDFSKIQGRFDTRLSLSSANVDAVIKKRILEKTEPAAQALRLLYEQKATIIKNLIVFNDTAEKKLYASAEDFAEVYPFVPYQFNLLSSVLTSIRTHGASGKHLSGGERSMLALFKESAVNVMNEEAGVIVPFHRFYDALENFLDHSHSGVIIRAYDNSYINPEKKDKDVFAINVLKTLFMVKYVLEIEANIDNITSLMIENIDDDRIELKGRVEEALKVLMRQMLIQKNGSIYVFLTDEEQEVNNEIEKENVETPEIITKVAEMIFEDIFPGKRYTYPVFNGRYAFGFNQFVDDRPYKANQNYDIGLRVLTPWYDGSTEDGTLRMMSGQSRDVLVVLPNDAEFLTEIQSYLKIEGFLRKNTSTQLAKYETIKEAKRVEMRERNQNAKLYLTEALKEATIYVNGDVVRVNGKEVISRINEAIGRLVQTVYHKLSYIDAPMGEAEIRKMLHQSNQLSLGLEGGTESNAKKAVRDVMKETFRATTSAEDEDTIMKNFQRYAQNTIYEIERLEVHYEQHHYPGKRVLSGGKALMQSVVQIQSALDFFTTVSKKRDDFFDFAEDYEPIKTFFSGEQSTIFARALDMLAIYDDSKTYIVNAELEDIVAQMRSITRQEKPYANIPKLPELRERFMSCYGEILQQESAPVLDSIDQAWKRVLEVLSTKDYNDQKRTAYYEKFQEIRDGATHCNNVSTLRSFADKADALKRRLLDEMADLDYKREIQKAEEEARRQAEEAKQSGNPAPEATVAPAPVKIRKTKNVSIKMMTGTASWRLESKEDIDRYMDSLRKSLEAQLDEDTIVNVEF